MDRTEIIGSATAGGSELGRVRALLGDFSRRLASVEQDVTAVRSLLAACREEQEWFTTREVARLLGRSEFTVRQWCNEGRLRGRKIGNGRGWRIARAEVECYRRDGLRPA